MSKFGKYVTPTYEKDFLMYGVLSYETKVKSMRHIMDYIYYYSATDDEETSIQDVPGLTMSELSNGHMVVEAMKRNPVLKQIILRFLTAREKPDHHVVQAIRWLSDTVTADAMDPTDQQRYRAAWKACVENPGPVFTDEGIDEDCNGTETSAETATEPEDANGLSGATSPKIEQPKVKPKKKILTRKKRGGKTAAKSKPHPLAKDAGAPPAGIAIEEWQRIYNNADSQQYKLHGKNSALSRGDRKSGVTREKAMYFIRNGHW